MLVIAVAIVSSNTYLLQKESKDLTNFLLVCQSRQTYYNGLVNDFTFLKTHIVGAR